MDNNNNTPLSRPKLPLWRRIIKVTAWTLLAIALLITGLVMGTISILRPEKLTPIVNSIANNNLNADVTIDRVELSLASTFPYLNLNVDQVTITSRDTKALDTDSREYLPQWVDTVLTVHNINGGINIIKILSNDLTLSDVTIDTPAINLAIIDDEMTNYNIFKPSEDTTTFNFADLPEIHISNLKITNPRPVRFLNAPTGTELAVDFKDIQLDGNSAPMYKLDFRGNVDAPAMLEVFGLEDLRFGLVGDIDWSQKNPYHIGLSNFDFEVSLLKGRVNTTLDFQDDLVINNLNFKLQPISISQAVGVAQALWSDLEIGNDLETDAMASISGKLTKPYNVNIDYIPCMNVDIDIPTCRLDWQDLHLNEFATNLLIDIPSTNLNEMTVRVNRLDMTGPATDIHIKGTFRNFMTDPYFDADINTNTDLKRLPVQLKSLFGGSINGQVTANAKVTGRVSMFSPQQFQHLIVQGDVGLRNIYWVSSDTVNMLYVDRALFKFDTQRRVAIPGQATSSPLLSADIEVDSCAIEHGTLIFRVRDFKLGLASRNSYHADTTTVHPMGGGISIGYFNFTSISDSATVRIKNAKGLAIARPMDGDVHRPEFIFKLKLDRISAGDNSTRMMVSNAKLDFNTSKKQPSKRQLRIKHIADSLTRIFPDLPPDSIYARALAQHRLHRRHQPRVHTEMVDNESEIIDWGASKGLKRWLRGWNINGSLTSDRARLFTPYFPLRNRIRNIDISFNNDSLNITNLQYKAGRSDLTLSGVISNMRRAFTSSSGRQPLKIKLESISDTIDINQLTATVFAGAAYSDSQAHGNTISIASVDNENSLDSIISQQVTSSPDSIGPFLVPTNIDLEMNLAARNVLYSDLLLHDFTGGLLAYDGAINLHDLAASSDVGSVNMSALYMGNDVNNLNFGFGLQLNNFNINRFLQLVPAVDSLMPVLKDFSGIISAQIAATSPVNHNMELELNRINAAIQISGDDLVLIDPDTFKSLSKWLLFKDKKRNIIDHITMQMTVKDGMARIYPFIFDIDRYRLGVQGYNDFALNFNYHIAVLKSPIPFKFGINLSGNPDKYKIRLGGAKVKEVLPAEAMFVDKTRVNLLKQIQGVFVRGVRNANMQSLKLDTIPAAANIDLSNDILTPADSARYIQEGLIPAPPVPETAQQQSKKSSKKSPKKDKKQRDSNNHPSNNTAILPKNKQ